MSKAERYKKVVTYYNLSPHYTSKSLSGKYLHQLENFKKIVEAKNEPVASPDTGHVYPQPASKPMVHGKEILQMF